MDVLAKRYASKNYHGLNLLGTLQVAGGVPGAAVGRPVLSRYSPLGSVVNASGSPWACVHLTTCTTETGGLCDQGGGFYLMYKELVKQMGFK